jgi:integrase
MRSLCRQNTASIWPAASTTARSPTKLIFARASFHGTQSTRWSAARSLRADVDRWLAAKAKTVSTRTLREVYACLNRSIDRAMARDKVKRNVVVLCAIPKGLEGRPSKSLTLSQAEALLAAAESSRIYAYVVLSRLIGARTAELPALTWRHVDLRGCPDYDPPTPPSVQVWHSVRAGGDTKTRRSRRTLRIAGTLRCSAHSTSRQARSGPCSGRGDGVAGQRPRLR